MTTYQYGDFERGFFTAALWSSNDESTPSGGYPLDDHYEIEDIEWETFCHLLIDCADFQANPIYKAAIEAESQAWLMKTDSLEARAGHDFWLTRCHHGAGFWDGDWKEPHGDALTELSHGYGNVDLYVYEGKICHDFVRNY